MADGAAAIAAAEVAAAIPHAIPCGAAVDLLQHPWEGDGETIEFAAGSWRQHRTFGQECPLAGSGRRASRSKRAAAA